MDNERLLQRFYHGGRVTHICVNKLIIISSDNCLSPDRRQSIIWTNAGILLIGLLGTNFSEIIIKIHTFKRVYLKSSSAKWRPFYLGPCVFINDHVTNEPEAVNKSYTSLPLIYKRQPKMCCSGRISSWSQSTSLDIGIVVHINAKRGINGQDKGVPGVHLKVCQLITLSRNVSLRGPASLLHCTS